MSLSLTLRDISILIKLFKAKYLTAQQIHALYWPGLGGSIGHVKACQNRLRLLTEAGYIRRIEQRRKVREGRLPYVYALAKRGAEIVAFELGISASEIDYHERQAEENYPFLTHLLATNSLHIALSLGCEKAGFTLEKWVDERELRAAEVARRAEAKDEGDPNRKPEAFVIPDGVCILGKVINGKLLKSVFFIEVDQATIALSSTDWEKRTWGKKVTDYLRYIKSNEYTKAYGPRQPRILTVTIGLNRLQNLIATTCEREGCDQFWFADQADAFDSIKIFAEPIWYVAGSSKNGPVKLT